MSAAAERGGQHSRDLVERPASCTERLRRLFGTVRTVRNAGRIPQSRLAFPIAQRARHGHAQRLHRVRQLQQEHLRLAPRHVGQRPACAVFRTGRRQRLMLRHPRPVQAPVNGLQTVHQIAQERRLLTAERAGQVKPVETLKVGDQLYSALAERVFDASLFPNAT